MIYRGVELKVLLDTLTITNVKVQEIRHYPFTDESENIEKGKEPTQITCNIKAESQQERLDIESLLASPGRGELELENRYYKRVVPGDNDSFEPVDPAKTAWTISTEFIALDPVPYDTETGDPLYD